MANLLYANNAVGTLAAPITSVATSVSLNAGQAALFPNPSAPQVFYATLTDASTQTLKEIVQVTAVSGNIFSIVRAQDGTSALSWNAGDFIEQCSIALEMRGWENAAEGLFNTLGVPVKPSTTLGIVGTTVADNANAGSVGEFLQNQINGSLVTGTPATVAQLTLSPGDWDVQGSVDTLQVSGTSQSALLVGLNATVAMLPAFTSGQITCLQTSFVPNAQQVLPTPTVRFNVSVATQIFAVAQANYLGGSMLVTGTISARRVR